MPSFKKYLKFDKLQNCYLNNWNIVSDFECVINKDTNQHEFLCGAYHIHCRNAKYSKDVGNFYDLNEYCKSLHEDLKYIEKIEKESLQNPIDMTCFNQKEFDEVKKYRFCKSKFNDCYDDRTIKIQEICDKEKLEYIIDNNDFDEEINRMAKLYYESLDS